LNRGKTIAHELEPGILPAGWQTGNEERLIFSLSSLKVLWRFFYINIGRQFITIQFQVELQVITLYYRQAFV